MTLTATLGALGILLGMVVPARAAEMRVLTVAVPAETVGLRAVQGVIEVEDGSGARHRPVVEEGVGPHLVPSAATRRTAKRPPDMLPDGLVSRGSRNIAAVWLIRPTTRYAHGVLGDAVEASGLGAQLADGMRLNLILDKGSVFEDQMGRLADFDGDGRDEILVVRSYLDRGAALAVVGASVDGLHLIAELPAIGRPNRWLNPVGATDLDGDGKNEAAVVITPHIGGTLKLYRLDGMKLREGYSQYGFSNHVLGPRELGVGAIIDVNGDGVPDLLIPDERRRALRVVTFASGVFRELARLPHEMPVVTGLVASDVDGDGTSDVVYGLADGILVAVLFTP